jgi:PAS domain S-box-containing protein
VHANQLLKDIQMYELYERREKHRDEQPLPQTLQDALSNDDPRAIVVTEAEAPFRVVEVNDAWIALRGFTKEEARHHSLSMIQGPDTNSTAVESMVELLLAGERAETLVTNYTKMGRKFYNHVRAGPIFNADQKITHFVGILEEVTEQPDYFQIARV